MSEENGEDAALFESRVGTILRDAREKSGLTLDEVAKTTRVPLRHLENIESGDYDKLPAPTYSIGFVKAYARAVGLSPGEMGQNFRDEIQYRTMGEQHREHFEPADPARVPPRWLAWTAAAIALLLALGYAIWRSGAFGGEVERAQLAAGTDRPIEAAEAPAGAQPGPAAQQEPPPATGPVVLEAEDVVWLRVYELDTDEVLYQQEMQPGDRFEIPADARSPAIRTARADALRVTVGGRRVAPLGPPEELIVDVSLLPEDLVARTPPAEADER